MFSPKSEEYFRAALLDLTIPDAPTISAETSNTVQFRVGAFHVPGKKQNPRWLSGEPNVELHIHWFSQNKQKVVVLVETQAKFILVHGNPQKFSGPPQYPGIAIEFWGVPWLSKMCIVSEVVINKVKGYPNPKNVNEIPSLVGI